VVVVALVAEVDCARTEDVRLRPKARRQLRVSESMVVVDEWFSVVSRRRDATWKTTGQQEKRRGTFLLATRSSSGSGSQHLSLERRSNYLALLECFQAVERREETLQHSVVIDPRHPCHSIAVTPQ
jgi:hypothetical protein